MLCTGLLAQSQDYNNEWINYNLTYYKFKIGATGLYRISQPTLATLGIGNTPAEHFQLWRNGQQIPVYTTVQTGPMGVSDYIEFWGEMNDGKPDNPLYRNPDFQLNDKWSLETDTVSFFLAINPGGNNLRLVPTNNTLPSALPAEPFFIHTAGKYYREKLNPGYAAVVGEYVYSSSYDQGEGWTSNDLGTGVTRPENLSNLYPYTGAGAPAPLIKVNATGNALNPRQFEIKINGTVLSTQTMDFFDYKKVQAAFSASLIGGGAANVEIKNLCTLPNDRMSIAQTELVYARQFDFGGANNFSFELPANTK